MYQRDTWVLIGWGFTLAMVLFFPSLVFAGMVAFDICYYEPGCHVRHAQLIQVAWLSLILFGEMYSYHRGLKLKKA